MRTKSLSGAASIPALWLGEPSAPLTMVIVANADDEPALAIIAPALVEALGDELSVCFLSDAGPATRVAIAGEAYDGPLRFVSLLAAVLAAHRAQACAAFPCRRKECAMRMCLACIRSALDNAVCCATATELRAWLEVAQSEERRLARLVGLAPGSAYAELSRK